MPISNEISNINTRISAFFIFLEDRRYSGKETLRYTCPPRYWLNICSL